MAREVAVAIEVGYDIVVRGVRHENRQFSPLQDEWSNVGNVARETCMKDIDVVVAVKRAVAINVDCQKLGRTSVFDCVHDDLSSVDSRQG